MFISKEVAWSETERRSTETDVWVVGYSLVWRLRFYLKCRTLVSAPSLFLAPIPIFFAPTFSPLIYSDLTFFSPPLSTPLPFFAPLFSPLFISDPTLFSLPPTFSGPSQFFSPFFIRPYSLFFVPPIFLAPSTFSPSHFFRPTFFAPPLFSSVVFYPILFFSSNPFLHFIFLPLLFFLTSFLDHNLSHPILLFSPLRNFLGLLVFFAPLFFLGHTFLPPPLLLFLPHIFRPLSTYFRIS